MTSLYLFSPTGLRRVVRSLYMPRNTSIYMYNANSKVRQAILNVMMLLWIGTIMVLPFVPKVNNQYHFNILIPYITDCGPNNPERSYFDNTIYIYIYIYIYIPYIVRLYRWYPLSAHIHGKHHLKWYKALLCVPSVANDETSRLGARLKYDYGIFIDPHMSIRDGLILKEDSWN